MKIFSNPHISPATIKDIPAIRNLLNSSYRGESSRQGWTTEADLIDGNIRTDDMSVKKTMEQTGSVFLKYTNEMEEIIGCVNLQQHDNRIYLGMFSVLPIQQGDGIGKQILQASEEYTKHLKCTSIYMSVISLRTELINWYQRHGYKNTGKRQPFAEDEVSGKHLQQLEFIIMEKII